MISLKNAIEDAFEYPYLDHFDVSSLTIPPIQYHMVVPANKPIFELPTIALKLLCYESILSDRTLADFDAIDIPITYSNLTSSYSTASALLKRMFMQTIRRGFIKFFIGNADSLTIYYGLDGLLLDKNFQPVLSLSWLIERKSKVTAARPNDEVYNYTLLKPIARISPRVFNKEDALQKYITTKFLKTVLDIKKVDLRYSPSPLPLETTAYIETFPLSIVIEDIPFKVMRADPPSVSITDEELKQIALNHLDEIPVL